MFDRTYYATHPNTMERVSNEALRDHYLIQNLFIAGQCVLNYTHADRFVIGGVLVGDCPVRLPRQTVPASAVGRPFLERRELGIFNVGVVAGWVAVDGVLYQLAPRDCLYVTMGANNVIFGGSGARFYLASCPAHRGFTTRRLGFADVKAMERGSMAEANDRRIHQFIIPGTCDSAQLVMGMTILRTGSVWNTMPPHTHERRSEIYFYFDLDAPEGRVFHFMGPGHATRHIVMQEGEAVISPPWSIHMGVGTGAYAFVWAMAGENMDYSDMDGIDIRQLA